MYHVAEAVRQTDLARVLRDIYLWLDHNRCSSDCLVIKKETFNIVVIEVSFDKLDLAEAFIKDFQGWALFPAIISEPAFARCRGDFERFGEGFRLRFNILSCANRGSDGRPDG